MSTTLPALGLSFLLVWVFKQPRKATQILYPIVGILLITAYLAIHSLGKQP